MAEKILVVIPTYNEKENLENIVSRIFEVEPKVNILIVDDNSPDGTGKIAETLKKTDKRVDVLHRVEKTGLGRAYLDGFRYALKNGADIVFEMDADFSHNPEYLPKFLKEIKDYEVVVGSRYVSGVNVINWPMSRLLLSYFANLYVRWITGMPITDATGGFKCFRRTALERINLNQISSSGYSFQIEVNYLCWKSGMKIKEIPIIFVDRQLGESKMSTGIVREAMLLLWKLRIKSLFTRHAA